MAVVARMRFQSTKNPQERGALALHDDGTFQIVPSDELRDEMARLEEVALSRAQTFGTQVGIGLLVLGALALGAGWLAGRIFGKLGSSLSEPRALSDVQIERDAGGGVHVRLSGLENRFRLVQMGWNGDEVLQGEAEAFCRKFEDMKNA